MEARLAKVERDVGELKGAVIQITHILVDQSERMDAGFRAVRGELQELRQELHGELQELRDSLGQRLDRLIAVTRPE
jgi:tetrahydromethanopterin S-methyltransferase subunit G